MNEKGPPASTEDTGGGVLEQPTKIPASYKMGDYSFLGIMNRVRTGKSGPQDAEQIERWIIGDQRGNTVKAYLCLMCNSSDTKKFIARDLREGLAAELLREGAEDDQPSEKEQDPVDRWVKIEHRTIVFNALSVLETYMADVIRFVDRDIRVKLADRLLRPDR